MRRAMMAALVLGLSVGVSFGDEIKSGPTTKIGGLLDQLGTVTGGLPGQLGSLSSLFGGGG